MNGQMQRREFITLLGGAAGAWPLAARAQSDRVRRIGVLMAYAESDPEGQAWVAAFREGLQKLGWTENTNVRIDYRWATAEVAQIRQQAKELVAQQPELILSSGSPTTLALVQQTRTLPIVFANLVDPIGQGFVASMSKPGGNVTGFANLEGSIIGKYLELLKEIAPRVTKVALFYNPETATFAHIYLDRFKVAAESLGVKATTPQFRTMAELETIMAAQAREPNGGLIAMPDGFNTANRVPITSLAARYRLPAIYPTRPFADAGGLMSYGNVISDNYRRAASYVDRILKGERPSELPVQFPVKFELVVNLKTARALGLDVPLFLQQRADEVIE
jgi:putative tryptophan/tyrosine transport system substrate-binding protein